MNKIASAQAECKLYLKKYAAKSNIGKDALTLGATVGSVLGIRAGVHAAAKHFRNSNNNYSISWPKAPVEFNGALIGNKNIPNLDTTIAGHKVENVLPEGGGIIPNPLAKDFPAAFNENIDASDVSLNGNVIESLLPGDIAMPLPEVPLENLSPLT